MTAGERWAALIAWYRGRSRVDRAIWAAVAAVVVLTVVYTVLVQPVLRYRAGLLEELAEGEERLARFTRFLATADEVRREREVLQQQLEKARKRFIPGDTVTLGAAHLQGMVQSLARETAITIQSTQVMREEEIKPFKQVGVRLTVSGGLRPLARFLAGIEYDKLALRVPFIEIRGRGLSRPGRKPRTLQATVEVTGFLRGPEPGTLEGPGGEQEKNAGAEKEKKGDGPPLSGQGAAVQQGVRTPSAEARQ